MVSFEESIQVDLNNTYKRIAYIFSPEIFGLKIILLFILGSKVDCSKFSQFLGKSCRLKTDSRIVSDRKTYQERVLNDFALRMIAARPEVVIFGITAIPSLLSFYRIQGGRD